jgi:2-oxoglutarate dehydrogenase E2 component (dihydrolipoamide succinyltransferase)
MARFELKLPKMGESVVEATLTAWLVAEGDTVAVDDGIVEVSTDKVDTELPSEVAGVLVEKRFKIEDVVKVGETIAIIETDAELPETTINTDEIIDTTIPEVVTNPQEAIDKTISKAEDLKTPVFDTSSSSKFLSPLVKSIAQKENISIEELETIQGTGKDQRLTKNDLLAYLENRGKQSQATAITRVQTQTPETNSDKSVKEKSTVKATSDEVIPMDRMGKLIAEHMIHSKQTSAHVQSFIEIDVTNIVNWRKKVKDQFLQQKGEKLTFTPIFMQAIAQTIVEYPMVNISIEGTNIIKKKDINLGMAAALPDGNLIVPVIKNADELSLVGMAKTVNKLAAKARQGKLSPDDIQGGTYTVTNVGSFGSITGTPIINQPQVAILALGAIRKMPSVIETADGDFIGIRHKMIVAHSYDHRVVNGALGGQFILRLKEILENFDSNQKI